MKPDETFIKVKKQRNKFCAYYDYIQKVSYQAYLDCLNLKERLIP